MTGAARPRIAVVYDQGSASAMELTRALGADFDTTYVLADSAYARGARTAFGEAARVVALGEDPGAAVGALAALDLDGIVTFSERMVPVTALLSDALRLRGHTPGTARRLTDKAEQRAALEAAGLPAVRWARVTHPAQWAEAAQGIGLPVVVKPVRGEGSRNTFAVTSYEEGAQAVAAAFDAGEDEVIVESFLVGRPSGPFGDYVSVESTVVDGVVTPYAVTGKWPLLAPFREVGQFWPAALPADDARAARDLAAAAIRALGVVTGLVHTEVKLTADGPRIIEVNGRVGGLQPELTRRAAGVDVLAVGARIAVGLDAGPAIGEPDRVCFQFYVPTPTGAGVLDRVTGAREIRRLDGVSGYRPYLVPGEPFGPAVSTRIAGVITGEVADHAEMLALVDACLARLKYAYVLDGREQVVSGTELTSA